MPQGSFPTSDVIPHDPTSENNRTGGVQQSFFTCIGSQFDNISKECYVRDLDTDIEIKDGQQGYAPVPVSWTRSSG